MDYLRGTYLDFKSLKVHSAARKVNTKIQKMRIARALVGDRTRSRVLEYVRFNPTASDLQIAEALELSSRQVKRHLKVLREAGLLTSEVTSVRGKTQFLVRRKLVVQSWHGHSVPEGQVGSEADDGPRAATPGNHPDDPEDLQ